MAKKDSDRTVALLEDVSSKFDVIMEYVKDIPSMKEKVDATFEETGKLREDVTIIKNEVSDILDRLDTVEKALKLIDKHDEVIEELRKRVEKIEKAAA